MAEYCVECFNKLNGTDYIDADVVSDYDLCEGCGEYKKCIVVFRSPLSPIRFILTIIYLIKTLFKARPKR